jgi:ribosome recycling factor
LRELAQVSVPEPTQLLVKPFDPSARTEIIKAIETADLGLVFANQYPCRHLPGE